jgi:preprotein translocase subunit Sss1
MAKRIATLVGVVFLLVGIVGFIAPHLLGAHLSMAHNLVHIISGALALYFGLKGTLAQAKLFCIVFGIVYALLGVVGFIAGSKGNFTIPGMTDMSDDRWLPVIKGTLELGTVDHVIHIVIGLLFLIGGFLTKADTSRATD